MLRKNSLFPGLAGVVLGTLVVGAAWLVDHLHSGALEEELRTRSRMLVSFDGAFRAHSLEAHSLEEWEAGAGRQGVSDSSGEGVGPSLACSVAHGSDGTPRGFNSKRADQGCKQALSESRNKSLRPDALERRWIAQFAAHSRTRELSGYRTMGGREWCYVARPISVKQSCLKCHGENGLIGGASLVSGVQGATLGKDDRWHAGQVVGASVGYVPTDDFRASQAAIRATLGAVLLLSALGLFGASWFLLRKLAARTAELRKAREHAETAELISSAFLANISHEIRTPLNAILGYADLMQRDWKPSCQGDHAEYLETIRSSGKHLLRLINDILDLSKIEADQFDIEEGICSPHDLILEVVSALRNVASEKNLDLDCRWDGKVPLTIVSDPSRFRQILMNLVGNAIKFTSVGKVEIVAEYLDHGEHPQLAVRVIDTGSGIPADKLKAIFEPFVQADVSVTRKFGGTGLGLTICRRIAEVLGGKLEVTSEVGKGSTFTVCVGAGPADNIELVDVSEVDGPPATGTQSDSKPAGMPPAKILLVEDSEVNRRFLGVVLRDAGAEVEEAENGQVGIERAMKGSFDMILMDMQMPVIDGYAATTTLRRNGFSLPILALTSHAMPGEEKRCREAGCSGLINKPVDANVLTRAVAEVLAASSLNASASSEPSSGPIEAPSVISDNACSSCAKASAEAAPVRSLLPIEDPEIREIVSDFVGRLNESLGEMRRAYSGGNSTELARLAHWLKGTGGTMGFDDFTEPAAQLEKTAKGGRWDDIEPALASLEELAARIVIDPAASIG